MTSKLTAAYEHLLTAETKKKSVAPLTDIYEELTIKEAYEIQLKGIQQKVKDGERIAGKKIGLTSVAMQKLLGVDQPDYGHLLGSMEVEDAETVSSSTLFQPKVEGEIVFVLKKGLKGPSVTAEEVMEATEYIVPSLEIVDSRIADWKIRLEDTIADNASCGLFVLGKERFSPVDMDLGEIEMRLYKNGKHVNTGFGKDVLGHPATCVAWLANKLYEFGGELEAGEVILSGALSAAVAAEPGDWFTAEFTQLGKVEVSFE